MATDGTTAVGAAREPGVDELRGWRRDLHSIPETGFDLEETLAYVRAELGRVCDAARARGVAASVLAPSRSALCLHLDLGDGPATAVRADMDALPVAEATGAPYASRHEGRMHACGHDGHTAMLLGLAWHLVLHARELPRSMLLVFQPAEETVGGARLVCESGVFERVGADRILGMHLWPGLPQGQLTSRDGAMLAATNAARVTFHGRGSHVARASEGADALMSMARFLVDVDARLAELSARERCLLKFGVAAAGEVGNQIPAEATLSGCMRTFSLEMRDEVQAQARAAAERAAGREGCTADVWFSTPGYPPVVNDHDLFGLVRAALPDLAELPEPLLIAEDFAWYQQHMPGVFLLLGTGEGAPLHSNRFDFDEAVLATGLDAYERLVRIP